MIILEEDLNTLLSNDNNITNFALVARKPKPGDTLTELIDGEETLVNLCDIYFHRLISGVIEVRLYKDQLALPTSRKIGTQLTEKGIVSTQRTNLVLVGEVYGG